VTRSEALDLCTLLVERWPQANPNPDELLADLEHVPGPMARTAVLTLSRDGREWPPTIGQIVARIADLALDAPPWGQVLAVLAERHRQDRRGQLVRWDCDVCDGSGLLVDEETRLATSCACRRRIIEERRARSISHPLVAAWVRTEPAERLTAAAQGETTAAAQCRDSWNDWVRDMRAIATRQDLEPAGLAAIERAQSHRSHFDVLTNGDRPELRRLRSVVALEGPADA
jgi:hypothetical protein